MRGGWTAALVVLAVWILPDPGRAETLRLSLEQDRLVVSGLPDILSRPEVKPHLTTGLTTTLVVAANASGKAKGGGRVDVRYELWDEVFLVTVVGADRSVRRETLPSFERLVAWWRSLKLPVLAAGRLSPAEASKVQVRVSLVPFSEAEQADAQKWLSDSVVGDKSNAEQTSASAEDASDRMGTVLDLLVATSIQRRALVSYQWNVTFQPERKR